MRHDAIIVGGSFAGLSAATYLGRAMRSVYIIDSGAPRNRFAAHSHGFLTRDGCEPGEMLAIARSQVAAYPTISFVEGEAVQATSAPEGFRVELATGEAFEGDRIILAFGVADELPPVAGLSECWGISALHCPYCHGYEYRGQRLGVLMSAPTSVHQAMLVAEWGPTTLYLNGNPMPDDDGLAQLHTRGIALEPESVVAVHGDGGQLRAIEFVDGRTSPVDALFLAPKMRLNSTLADQLGCALEEGPPGTIVRTDEMKMTTVAGVFAAGDIARLAHSVTWASADGVMAGVAAHRSLVFDRDS
jgi:thioredoxin reductase